MNSTREAVWNRFADTVGVSASKSAELLGYKNRSIISKEKDGPVGAQMEMKIRRFCEKVGLNAEYILTGEGDVKGGGNEMLHEGCVSREEYELCKQHIEMLKESIRIQSESYKTVIDTLRRVAPGNGGLCIPHKDRIRSGVKK